jgi:hypothetical protein
MFTTSRTPAFWLALISLILSVSLGIAACTLVTAGGPVSSPAPSLAAPTAQPGQPTAAPTAQPGQPTAAPTAQPGQPTAQPAAPIIGFNPKAGGPGTAIDVFGSGYTPGAWYVVRLGLPHPTGEALFSAQADANGRWSGRFTMPAALPSGQPIPDGQLFLVAMDDQNTALASAPFAFAAAPAQQFEDGPQLVSAMLEAYRSGADVRPYLSPDLVQQIDAGRPAHQLLGLHPVALQGFSFGEAYSYPQADLSFLPATLTYQGFSEERVFTVAFHYDATPPAPKIYASELAREGRPVATGPEDAAQRLLLELWADRSGRRALPYLGGPLRDRVARGEQVDLLEQGGAGPMLPLHSYRVVRLVAEDEVFKYVEVAVDLGEQLAVTRFVKAQELDGAWRVVEVLNALADQPPPDPEFPGAGWTAWKQGDFNGDGLQETVYLKETDLVAHDRLDDPLLSSDSLNATAVLVAQDGAHGRFALLEIDSQSARTSDGFVIPFATGATGPAFFQVAVSYAYEGRFLHILPLNAEGRAFTQALAFKWRPAHSGYRPIGGPHGEW